MTKRILSVDLGDRRTGLAVSDETCVLASGIGCIKEDYIVYIADEVVKKAVEYDVCKIVVGNPVNMNGTKGPRSEKAQGFVSLLEEKTDIPVVLFDERLTTVSAHQYMNMTNTRGKKRKETVDTLSAEIILQNYLDYLKNHPSEF